MIKLLGIVLCAISVISPAPTSSDSSIAESWIAYQGGTGGPARIRLVHPDGTEDHVIADNVAPGEQFHPDWSPDGMQLAFAIDDADGTRDIWTMVWDGTGATRIFDCIDPCYFADEPAWSPDGSSIFFETGFKTGHDADSAGSLERFDVATGAITKILETKPGDDVYGARWSPDGRQVVVELDTFVTLRYDEDKVASGTVGIVDLAATTPVFAPLLPKESRATGPDWSPSGDRISFVRPASLADPDGPADVWVMGADGSDPTQLTNFGAGGGWAIQATWLPDGSGIVFVAEDTIRTHPNVAMIHPDGSGLTRFSDQYFRTHPRARPAPAN